MSSATLSSSPVGTLPLYYASVHHEHQCAPHLHAGTSLRAHLAAGVCYWQAREMHVDPDQVIYFSGSGDPIPSAACTTLDINYYDMNATNVVW